MRTLPGQLVPLSALGVLMLLPVAATPTPAQAAAPQSSAAPQITGNRRVTQILNVTKGRWRGEVKDYGYRWVTTTQNGVFRTSKTIRGATRERFRVTAAQAGLRLGACVRARGADRKWSSWRCTQSTRIVPPGNLSRPTARGSIRANGDVTGTVGRWRAATRGLSYAWQTSDNGRDWTFAIGPQRARSSYRVAPGDVGLALRLRVIGRNEGGNSLPVTSNVIAPVPPTPGTPIQRLISQIGDRYMAADGSWEGGRILATRYIWQVAPTASGEWSDAPGATDSPTYQPPRPDVARYLRVTVIKTNGGGSASVVSEPVALPSRHR